MKKQDKISTKEKLLEVAIEEFAEYGYDGVSTRSLTSKAGLNNYAISYHFGSKKDLHMACIDSVVEQYKIDLQPLENEINFLLENNLGSDIWRSLLKKSLLFHIKIFISNKTKSRYIFFLRLKLSKFTSDEIATKISLNYEAIKLIISKANNLTDKNEKIVSLKCMNIFSLLHSLVVSKHMMLKTFNCEDYTPEFVEEFLEYLLTLATV